MSKGTILYVGGFELPDKNAAAHRVLSNGKIFRELGYKVVFVDIDKNYSSNISAFDTHKMVDNFDCWSLSYPKTQSEWIKYLTNIESFKIILKEYSDVKFIIAYNFPSVALLKMKYHCNKNNIRLIADCTEWYSTEGMNLAFKIIKGTDSFLRMRVVQKRLDGIIVISKFLENYYSNFKSLRVPPLVDIKESKWATLNKNEDNIIKFIYSGSPGKNKDRLDLVIDALYKLKNYYNYQLNIVGISKDNYLTEFPKHGLALEVLHQRVKFHGRVSHTESMEMLKKSDFSIFLRNKSRLTEAGFPTKFVESISAGVPVITTCNSDVEEFLDNNVNGYLIDNNLGETLEKVLSLNKDKIVSLKKNVKTDLFDYRNFTHDFKIWIEKFEMNY